MIYLIKRPGKSGVATGPPGGADDEIHIVVSDEDGVISGTKTQF